VSRSSGSSTRWRLAFRLGRAAASYAGHTTLTQSMLSTIPVHICCYPSDWAICEIDRRRRAFLWAWVDTVSGGRCKVDWPLVCAPKDHGGLGIPDLRILGFALRLRWE
jgi:hypothetical protein